MRRSRRIRLWIVFSLTVPLLGLIYSPASARADQWTNLAGTSTISGEMLGLWNGRVLLQLESGRRVSVRMEDLRADSRIQAEKRLNELNERLQQQREEIRTIAEELSAAAPQELPELPEAPSYQPPEPGVDLQTALISIRNQTLAGHLRVYYDTLPASHQKLVDELAAAVLAKLNTASYESTRTTLLKLADLIVTRQRWLFSYPQFAQLPEPVQSGVLNTAHLITALAADDVASLQTLRSRPFSESVASLSDAVSPHIARLLAEHVGSIEMSNFEVEPGPNETMIASVTVPIVGTVHSTTYTQVEGRWVEGEDAQWAADDLKELQKSLEPLPDDSLQLPPAAQSVIDQLGAAMVVLQQPTTRQEFHRELDNLLPEFVAAINQWSGYKPPIRPGFARQFPQGGYTTDDGSAVEGDSPADSADYDPSMR